MKPVRKRILSLFLSMLMVLGCLPFTAGAASSQTIYYESSNIKYGTAFSFRNPYGDGFPGGTHNWNSTTHVSYIHVGSGIGYCIQPGIRIGDGPGDKVEYAGGSDSSYYKKFPAALRRALGLVSLYGYPNAMTDKNAYYATQVMIWGLVIGQVDPSDFTGTNKFYTCLEEATKKAVKPYYESLLRQLRSHETRPSFTAASSSQAKPITLQWDSGSKRYEATVTDSNEVLSQFDFTASGLTISRKGNQLTLSSAQPISNPISVSSDKVLPEVKVGSPLVWTSKESLQQEVLSGAPYTYVKCLPTFRGLVMAMTDHTRMKVVDSFFTATRYTLPSINFTNGDNNFEIPLPKVLMLSLETIRLENHCYFML